jgi:hypothetical protein
VEGLALRSPAPPYAPKISTSLANQSIKMSTVDDKRENSLMDKTSTTRTENDTEKGSEAAQSSLVDWDGDNDPLDPRTFSPIRKWIYVGVVSMGSLLV